MAIKLELISEMGTCFVYFDECEELDDISEPRFTDKSMCFPWDGIPNEYGYMPRSKRIAIDDFLYKAEILGYKCKVIDE